MWKISLLIGKLLYIYSFCWSYYKNTLSKWMTNTYKKTLIRRYLISSMRRFGCNRGIISLSLPVATTNAPLENIFAQNNLISYRQCHWNFIDCCCRCSCSLVNCWPKVNCFPWTDHINGHISISSSPSPPVIAVPQCFHFTWLGAYANHSNIQTESCESRVGDFNEIPCAEPLVLTRK